MGSLRVGHNWATSLSLSCIGEGNGNPLQCSCLENPRDGGAWWAAIYGVAQSRKQLKRLSSSSSSSRSKGSSTFLVLPKSQVLPRSSWDSFIQNHLLKKQVNHLSTKNWLPCGKNRTFWWQEKAPQNVSIIFKCVLLYWWYKKNTRSIDSWIQNYMYSLALNSLFMVMSLNKWKAPQIHVSQLCLLIAGCILANNWAFLSLRFLTGKNFT